MDQRLCASINFLGYGDAGVGHGLNVSSVLTSPCSTDKFFISVENATCKSQRQASKFTNSHWENPFFEVFVRVVQETPKIFQAVSIALDCDWECKESPYWRSEHAHQMLSQRPLSWNWPESLLPENLHSWYHKDIQVSNGWKQPTLLPTYDT